MPIIATDFCLQIPCKATVPAYPRLGLDHPRFWTVYLLTSFTKPLSRIGSIHVPRAYPSQSPLARGKLEESFFREGYALRSDGGKVQVRSCLQFVDRSPD